MQQLSPAQIFDPRAVRRNLSRALKEGFADPLMAVVADDFATRLSMILRDFDVAVDLGSPHALLFEALRASPRIKMLFRGARVAGCESADFLFDSEAIPLADSSVGLIVSAFALEQVNDLPGALLQIRKALKPDGLFMAAFLGGRSLWELRAAFLAAEEALYGGASPRVIPFIDVRAAGQLLQRAGFALPVTDSETLTLRYAHPLALMRDLRAMGWSNALLARSKRPMTRAFLAEVCAQYQRLAQDADGRVRATFEVQWISGWAPHESQQKPLKPGSAKARLAEALGVPEHGA